MVRKILGILIGAFSAIAISAAIGWLNGALYPVSLDIDAADPETLAAVIGGMPVPAKLIAVAAWFCGAFGGAWLALRICDWRWAGWIIAAVVVAQALLAILNLPHPLWMQACALLLPLLGGWFAVRLHHKPYPGEPLLG